MRKHICFSPSKDPDADHEKREDEWQNWSYHSTQLYSIYYAKQKMLDVAKKFDLLATVSDELTKVFDSAVITQPFAGDETKYLQDERKWD